MLPTFLTLFSVSLVLYILSFFMRNRIKELEEQVEEVSLNTIQETYQLKKKMRVLEEELLLDEPEPYFGEQASTHPPKEPEKPNLGKRVLNLYQQGYTTKQIAEITSMKEHDIFITLRQHSSDQQRGVNQ